MYFVFSDRADALQGIIVRCCETSTESEASLDRDQVLHFSRILASDQGLSRNQNKTTFFQQTLGFKRSSKTGAIIITQDSNLKSENANYHNSSRSGLRWKPILDALKAQRTTPMGARANKLGAKYCAAAVSCNLEANIGGGGSTDQRRKVTLIRKSLFWKPAAAADPIVSLKVFQVSCGAKVNPQPQGAAVSLVGRLSFNVIRINKPNEWLEAEHVNCIFLKA